MNKTFNVNEAMSLVMSVMTSPAPDEAKLLHKKVAELLRHKMHPGSKAPFHGVANNPGWYWMDTESGIMLKVGDNGRLYIRCHYQKAHEWIRSITTQVPLKWLGIEAFRTMAGQFGINNTKAYTCVPMHVLSIKVWGSSDLRELFQKLITEKMLGIHLDGDGDIAEYDFLQNKGFVRAEHNIKGLRGLKFPSHEQAKCVKPYDGGLHAFDDPSKLNERVTKIFANTDGLYVGRWKAIVVLSRMLCSDSKMQAELDNAFCTGNAYSSGMFNFIGPARLVTKSLGGKMTIASPFAFKEFGDHAVIANMSSWKGGLNMLLNHTGVMSVEEQIKFCEEHPKMDKMELTAMAMDALQQAGEIKTMRVTYRGRGVDVVYAEVEEDFYSTNLYVLYGCQYKEVADQEAEDSDEYEMKSLASSYYLHSRTMLKQCVDASAFDFSLAKQVYDDLESGAIVKSKPITSFSIREMTNFFWSYCVNKDGARYVVDVKPLKELMDQLLAQHQMKGSRAHKEMQRLVVDGYGTLPRITGQEALEFINRLFSVDLNIMGMECSNAIPIPERGWSRMESGLSKLSDEDFAAKWKTLMAGDGVWPGMGNNGFVIEIEGYDFLIPGYKFLKPAIMPVDKKTYGEDNPECMFGDTMQTIMMLMMVIRRAAEGKAVEWSFNAAQHMIRMNAALFKDRLNRMAVKGTYLTLATRFWGADDKRYACAVSTLAADAGPMSYSKDPVLFDKGVTGVFNSHDFPKDIFGDLSDHEKFAMKSVAFINNTLMLSQENDADGDMCCLRFDLTMPMYTGQWDCMKKRVKYYVDRERQYDMVMKPWKQYSNIELAWGIHANRVAKENIGLMTSGFSQHAMLLENAILNGSMNPFWAKMLWNMYGYIVQDEAMRMIKHSGGASNADTGRSAYYESTSVMSLLKGDVHTMFFGIAGENDTQPNGFLAKVADYWAEYDIKDSRRTGSLQSAIMQYGTATANFCYAHYKTHGEYQTSGHHNCRLTGNNTAGMQLALDIARGKCTNNVYKLYNVLQRGYFRHVEDRRLMVSNANATAQLFAQNDIAAPKNGVDVIMATRYLSKQEIKIPAHCSMALAFRLDGQVRTGWFAQHIFIGKLKMTSNDNSVNAVRWMDMISQAVQMNKDRTEDDRDAAMIQKVKDALMYEDYDVNYPDAENWGE